MNRRPPWRPTGRGLGVAGMAVLSAAIGGWFGSPALLVLAVSLTTAVAAAAVVVVVHSTALHLGASSFAAPALVAVGGPSAVEVSATGAGAATLRIDRADGRWRRPAGPGAVDAPLVHPGRLAPPVHRLEPMDGGGGRPWRCTSPAPTGERGTLVLASRLVWLHDPLGLFAAAVAAAPPVTVVVYPTPATAGVDPVETRTTASAAVGGFDGAGRAPVGGGELAGVRPYTAGDRLHLVHWPSLARPGPILVKELAPDATDAVVVVIDDRIDVHPDPTFEAMLQVACGLVLGAWRTGHDLVLATCSGRRVAARRRSDSVGAALEMLAGLAPSGRMALAPAEPATTVTSRTGARSLPAAFAAAGPVVAVP